MTITLAELQADREAGTKGPWEVGVAESVWAPAPSFDSNGPFCQLATVRATTFGDNVLLVLSPEREANLRRIARLPDTEAALIEAVGVLREARDAIASLEEYDLGGVAFVDPHTGEHAGDYPIRDELLSKISALLAKLGADK